MTYSFDRHTKIVRFYQRAVALLLCSCLTISLFSLHNIALANSNKLLVAPVSSQVNLNIPFTVNVRSYAGTTTGTGTVSGTIKYQAGLLRVESVTATGSAYGAPTVSQSSGSITFSGSRTPGDSGMAHILTITFKPIAVGTATVSFDANSTVNSSGTDYANGSFKIIDPNPKPSPPTAPRPPTPPRPVTPPVSSTPQPTQPSLVEQPPTEEEAPPATPDPTGLVDAVSVQQTYSTGTVRWSVNAPNAKSTLRYGQRSNQLTAAAEVVKQNDGTFSAGIKSLSPGVRYFFTIDASGDGNKTGSYSGTITTPGLPVVIEIKENNTLVKQARVTIGNRTYNASNGKIAVGLAAGKYSGKITTQTASQTINFTVASKEIPTDGSAPESQRFSYSLASSVIEGGPGSGVSILAFVGIMVVGILLLAFGFIGFMAYRRKRFEASSPYQPSSTVIIEDGYNPYPQQINEAPSPYTSSEENRD